MLRPIVNINADMTAHSGNVAVGTNVLTSTQTGTSAVTTRPGGAQLTLASGATIDTSRGIVGSIQSS